MTAGRVALAFALLALVAAPAPSLPLAAPALAESQRLPHPPIAIEGDAGFASPLSGVRGGRGTLDDPYVISSWTIVTADHLVGIHVVNTTKPFVIEDVDVLTPCCHTAFLLENVRNATLRRITTELHSTGVRVEGSADVRIEDARFGMAHHPNFRPGVGFHVRGSRDVTIERAESWANAPFIVMQSRVVTVRDSVWWGPVELFNGGGAWLSDVRDVTVLGNLFRETGIALESAESVALVDNVIAGGDTGISADWSGPRRDLLLCGNTVSGVDKTAQGGHNAAVDILGATGVTIIGNTLSGNDFALSIGLSTSVRVDRNAFSGSASRSAAIGRYDAEVHGNSFVETVQVALGAGARADGNWWGAADGPSLDGPGSGTPVDALAANATFTPWLGSAPSLAVDCDAELEAWRA